VKHLPTRFRPALFLALRHYSTRTFVSDLIAGVTVGLVALPLAMAFAISSGMTPQAGTYCAVVTGWLGGSYVQIGGPTGAFVVVVAGIIAEYGVDGPVGFRLDCPTFASRASARIWSSA
jgi:SulP family sulfate permease